MERKPLRELVDEGVLLTSRALAAGWPRRSLTRALRVQGWVRLYAGAWAEPGSAPALATRLRAVQLVRPRLVASHGSAAALWRIETLGSSAGATLEFIDPGRAVHGNETGVRVHRMLLERDEVVGGLHGLRFTSARRTLTDLLRAGPRDDAIVAVDSALGYRKVDGARRPPLTDMASVEAHAEGPLPGYGAVENLAAAVRPTRRFAGRDDRPAAPARRRSPP